MNLVDLLPRVIEFSPWVTLMVVALYSLAGGVLAIAQDPGMRTFVMNFRKQPNLQPRSVDVTIAARHLMLLSAASGMLRLAVFVVFAAIATAVPTGGSLQVRAAWYVVPPALAIGVITGSSQCLRYRHPPWIGTRLRSKTIAALIVVTGSVIGALAVGLSLLMLSTAVVILLLLGMLPFVIDLPAVSPVAVLFLLVVACVPSALGVFLLQWSPTPSRLARSILQPAIRELMGSSVPVTLLRSFEDDALTTRTPPGQASLAESFASESFVRFEEVLAWELWRTGPVIALGQPGQEGELPLGAVREYFDDSNWQSGVVDLLAQSRLILVVAGRAPGLGWEYTELRARGFLAKTIFVIPPISDDKWRDRRLILESALNLSPEVLDTGPNRMPLCLQFDCEGSPVVMCAAGREGRAYVAALRAATRIVEQQGQAAVHGPAAQYFAPADNVQSLYRSFDPEEVPRVSTSKLTGLAGFILWP